MLSGPFAKSTGSTIQLVGDDPQVARLCFELIHLTFADTDLDWTSIKSRVMPDRAAFDAFVDKYDLRGVKSLVAHELQMERDKQQLKDAKEDEKKRGDQLVRNIQRIAPKPGKLVNIFEFRPAVGTRVRWNKKYGLVRTSYGVGTIIANDLDNGTEIGVRWSNDREYDNLKCGKKDAWISTFS